MYRIGIDARLLAYRKGGIAEYTRQLIDALAALDSENAYAVFHRYADTGSYCPAPNFRRINTYTPAHHRFERTALSLELWPRRLDLLHSPDFIAPRWGAKRHIITIHDLHFLHYPTFQTAASLRYYRDQIAASVQRADHILAQTEGTRQEIISLLNVPSEKITVHLLGVHPAFQALDTQQVHNVLSHYEIAAGYLLFVGTIEPRKNLTGMIRAYQRLKSRRVSTPPLVIVGQKGWHADDVVDSIANAGKTVHWLDNVPFADLPAFYNGARALVLPSFHEGFGLPAVEAMACGTPVVVSARGSLPEVVGDAGVYIDPDDVDAIAHGIETLLSDDALYQQLQVAGRQRASLFSWQKTAEIAVNVYQKVLST